MFLMLFAQTLEHLSRPSVLDDCRVTHFFGLGNGKDNASARLSVVPRLPRSFLCSTNPGSSPPTRPLHANLPYLQPHRVRMRLRVLQSHPRAHALPPRRRERALATRLSGRFAHIASDLSLAATHGHHHGTRPSTSTSPSTSMSPRPEHRLYHFPCPPEAAQVHAFPVCGRRRGSGVLPPLPYLRRANRLLHLLSFSLPPFLPILALAPPPIIDILFRLRPTHAICRALRHDVPPACALDDDVGFARTRTRASGVHVSMDADEQPPRVSLALSPSPPPPRFSFPCAPQMSGAPSSRTDFACLSFMSPYPVAGVSPSAEADTLPPADVEPSPPVCFIEPVADASPRDADVESSADVDVEDRELEEDLQLLSVGEQDAYRTSPPSPGPTPESEEEAEAPLGNVPRVLTEEAVSAPVPVESDAPAPAALAREPSPGPAVVPAPPPVPKVSFKEWQARRKLERAKEAEVAQEREREREREWEREHEKDAAQGEDKENEVVPAKAEDGLTRILDGIRRSADVEMADAVPLAVAPAVAPFVTLGELQLKAKMVPLSMTAFIATGNEHLLPPLAMSSVVESRTPSPSLSNEIKREASLNDVASPVVLAPKSPPSDVPAPPSP
ncbi:hypothetical protein B0H14DRAFT_3486023 [Mycena olivaceomarginata]|nr:hypothetical protein B0H14DRAFT_3486023 [Mycena olivaceomarginata]